MPVTHYGWTNDYCPTSLALLATLRRGTIARCTCENPPALPSGVFGIKSQDCPAFSCALYMGKGVMKKGKWAYDYR